MATLQAVGGSWEWSVGLAAPALHWPHKSQHRAPSTPGVAARSCWLGTGSRSLPASWGGHLPCPPGHLAEAELRGGKERVGSGSWADPPSVPSPSTNPSHSEFTLPPPKWCGGLAETRMEGPWPRVEGGWQPCPFL